MTVPASIGGFQVVRELGRGGMGVVYEVRREGDPRRLALKVLPTQLADDEALARFRREGELMARVDHPNVVRVHDLGETETGVLFLVSDLIEGEDLEERLRRGPLPRDEAVRLVRDLARGVEKLHDVGILHRDLKPANVIVRARDGAPILLDFGLARDVGAERLTHTGALLGSPATMAPEQARGAPFRELGPQVDVYGLGAILFSLLAGGPPFMGVVTQVLLAVLEEDPDWSRAEGLDLGTQTVLRRAMAKAPEDRYPTAAALADDLDRVLRNESIAGGRSPALPALLFGAVAIVAGGFGLSAALKSEPTPAPTPTTSPSLSQSATPNATPSTSPPPRRGPPLRRVAELHPLHQRYPHVPDAALVVLDDRTVVTRCPHVLQVTHRVKGAWVEGLNGAKGRSLTAVAYWSPDEVAFVDEIPGLVKIWNVRTGRKTREFNLSLDRERRRVAVAMRTDRKRGVVYIAFARDGYRKEEDVGGWGGIIRLTIDPLDSRPFMDDVLSDVHDMTLTPDGTLVAVGSDRRRRRLGRRQTIAIWGGGRWDRFETVAIHSYHPSVADGLLATGSSDGYVALWKLGGSKEPSYLGPKTGMAEFGKAYPLRTRSRVVLRDGWAFTAGFATRVNDLEPNRIKVWNLKQRGKAHWEGPKREAGYLQIGLTPDGTSLFALRRDCVLERWSVEALKRKY